MKKGITILFLLVLIASQSGYWVYQYLLSKSEVSQNQRLKNHEYSDKNLLELKIPLNLPYYLDEKEFREANGEILFNGNIYSYVKTKVKKDTLYLLCLRNDFKSQIITEHFTNLQKFSHLHQNLKSPINLRVVNLLGIDFLHPHWANLFHSFTLLNKINFSFLVPNPLEPFLGVPQGPPENS